MYTTIQRYIEKLRVSKTRRTMDNMRSEIAYLRRASLLCAEQTRRLEHELEGIKRTQGYIWPKLQK